MSNEDIFEDDSSYKNEVEKKHFMSVLASFKYYRKYSFLRVNQTEKYLNSLPTSHQNLLKKYRENLKRVRECIEANYKVILHIIRDVDCMFHNVVSNISQEHSEFRPTNQDMDKVQSTLKQFVRDWSKEGAEERKQCYEPIIKEIESYYPGENGLLCDIKVLVPGAGLGRLAYELAHRGYSCQGNEFSVFMLFASNFVLNRCSIAEDYTIYPWLHQNVNNVKRTDQTEPSRFPDVVPILNSPLPNFSMVAGDFLEVYKDPNVWHCVATCFFIDCANNVVEFIETIYNILMPGGLWVNLGPLLYHYSDVPFEFSIEPSLEDLLEIIQQIGFVIKKVETDVQTKYAQNPRSMQQSEYKSVFFVCIKPENEVLDNGHNGA
ncbi:carnosine N-methyltransferase [Ctenocephalides felis]|uniref:carnosine N-methyltransferase n=1 Tax=Ctenocephalides felis TaxID=7515 RepID=UPI000E6E1040|nr:carnosine N-methyltransferase [Ctenocephalides felis]